MQDFRTLQEAVEFIKQIDITQSKDKHINDIMDNGICKIGNTIVVVDGYEPLND